MGEVTIFLVGSLVGMTKVGRGQGVPIPIVLTRGMRKRICRIAERFDIS
jgi:hypothetical protein